MLFFMKIIGDFTISAENSCFSAILNMIRNIFKLNFLSTLTCDSSKEARCYVLQGLIIFKNRTLVLFISRIFLLQIKHTFKLLLLQLLFSKSVNRLKSSFSASNWASSLIYLRILHYPLV
jgi:hypothetical protein